MNLEEFKAQKGIENLPFHQSTTEGSNRLCAYVGDISIITTEEFDKDGDMRVYDNPKGVEGRDYILSNTVQKDAVMVL